MRGLPGANSYVYNQPMPPSDSLFNLNGHRRDSAVSEFLSQRKFDDTQKLSPEQRLLLALALADISLRLSRSTKEGARDNRANG